MDVRQDDTLRPEAAHGDTFVSTLLKPGSSLHPTSLLILDAAFLCLLLVLVTLVFLTAQNPHIFALILIEFCLWGSVKWFIYELKTSRQQSPTIAPSQDETKEKSD